MIDTVLANSDAVKNPPVPPECVPYNCKFEVLAARYKFE